MERLGRGRGIANVGSSWRVRGGCGGGVGGALSRWVRILQVRNVRWTMWDGVDVGERLTLKVSEQFPSGSPTNAVPFSSGTHIVQVRTHHQTIQAIIRSITQHNIRADFCVTSE